MENNPLVSVIIPTYNRKEYAVKAIKSVLAQTYKNSEIIVIDDCSTDGTKEFLQDICQKHSNIVFVKNDVNLGFVKNLNKGVSFAKGKYIARLDDDDEWCDVKKIEKQVNFLEQHSGYVLTGGGVIKTNKEGRELVKYLTVEQDTDIRKFILMDNMFAHSTVLFRKDAFIEAGGYDGQFGFFADWALWLELGKLGKFYNFQEFFIHYLDQELQKGTSARDYEIRRKLLAKIKLHTKYRNYYPGGNKAFLLSFASYIYSFIPFRKQLWPFIFEIRKLIFGFPPYTYFK